MKAAYITAGAAGMYCGSCLHDNTLAAALQELGHEVALIPTYTPIRTDENDVSIDRVFYGAINVYLEQKLPLFRRAPHLVGRILSSPKVLGWVSRIGSFVDAGHLGDLTLSMLQGEYGRQSNELDELVSWLADDFRPEIVHITNSMLVGMARRMKERLGVPVVCSVQGEDIFLEQLEEPFHSLVRDTLRERARDVDGFVATSQYYADFMTDYLGVPPERMHHVPLGLKLGGHGAPPPDRGGRPFTVGYLARVCPEKGLHLLCEGFRLLTEKVGRDAARLRIAGWLGSRDRAYLEQCMRNLRSWGLEDVVEYVGEVDRTQKIDFIHSLDVLSVPTVYREPKGLYVLEALANGVPVVQPRHGAFPEMIEATGGGILVDPQSPEALAAGLRELMDDPGKRQSLGRQGKEAVHRNHTDTAMARATLALYRHYLD
jgi:glycosyltransferase involved in cell wall biosynthesis